MGLVKRALRAAGDKYIDYRTRMEYERQRFVRTNERPVEYGYVFKQLNQVQPQTVLDVGTGQSALPALLSTCGFQVTAIDNATDYWPSRLTNRHWHVLHDDIRASRLSEPFDAVVCVSTLEHIPEHADAMREMLRLTRPGGHLILTFPYNETTYHPNVYAQPDAAYGKDLPYVTQSFSRRELDQWLGGEYGGVVVDQEYWKAWTGDLWVKGDLHRPIERVESPAEPHQLTCLTIRKH